MIVDAIVKQTEHKTTRKPCDDFRSEVYHLGEFTGRGIASLAVAQPQEEELVERYGMKSDALRQGIVYFEQMQCMHRVTLNYLKLPGPLLGVGTDAAKISCGGGSKLDADEREATAALRGMLTKWTQWETSSGIRDAIQAREEAKKDAIKLGPLAQIDPILRGVKELLRAVPQAHELDELLAE